MNIRKSILATMMTVCVLTACQESSLTTSPSLPPVNVESPAVEVSADQGRPDNDPTQCELIGITARRVLSVSPGQVVLLVSASYSGDGTPYVRVIDRESGRPLGDYPLGNITLRLDAGRHELFIFVEVSTASGTIQCDGSVSFTIPEGPPPPPPPTPGCTEDCEPPPPPPECGEDNSSNDDDCEPPPQCTTGDDCNPPPPPPPPQVCNFADGGPFPKQGNPTAECGFFNTTPGDPGFYICKAGQDMYVSSNPFTGLTCPNGKEISHITTCACPEL